MYKILFVYSMCFWLVGHAHANEEDKIKAVFLNTQFIIEDSQGEPWRFVEAENSLEALINSTFLAEGVTTLKGKVNLTDKQQQILYTVWKKNPTYLWLVYNSHCYSVQLESANKHYQFVLIEPESDAERKIREEHEKMAIASQTPLTHSTYTQAGFDDKRFILDYKKWQQMFKQDYNLFESQLRKDKQFGLTILEDKNTEALKQSFAQSIDNGAKGISLRQVLISAYYAPTGHEGTEITPSGSVIARMLLSESAIPVGYGGTFSDEGKTIELWYMIFEDMSEWTMQDFNESLYFKGFSPAVLPPYKTTQRNSWPALVFTRQADGSVQLYGMSMEVSRILGTIYNAQLF
jgi:hypothetical protein